MLGKLMKYELKATARTLIPLYIALLAFAIINKIFMGTGFSGINSVKEYSEIPFILSILAYGCTMAAIVIVTLFIVIQRFYKNLLGDEGYLMNTLPVTTVTNITSKLSIATFWNIISGLVAILSIVIMVFEPVAFSKFFSELFKGLYIAFHEIGIQMYILIIEGIITILVSIMSSITMIYASISIGHLFSKHRILSSFGAFIVFNIITGAVSSPLKIAFSFSNFDNLFSNMHSLVPVHAFLIFSILFNLLFFIAYFIITNYILKNKLNLE